MRSPVPFGGSYDALKPTSAAVYHPSIPPLYPLRQLQGYQAAYGGPEEGLRRKRRWKI